MVWVNPVGGEAASLLPDRDPLVPGGTTTVDPLLRYPPAQLPMNPQGGADSDLPPGDDSKTNQLTVTALIVSWNSLGLIRSCLESLANQTAPPQQVVVVDNGSND